MLRRAAARARYGSQPTNKRLGAGAGAACGNRRRAISRRHCLSILQDLPPNARNCRSSLRLRRRICSQALASRADIRVKWPNDVLAEGRKIAGILLESASTGAAPPQWLAIGIGINLQHFPPDTEFPAISLAALGAEPPTPRDALAALASAFAKWYEVWRMRGFVPIREAWLARAAGLGARIVARLSNGEATGVFEGLDETGALILRETHGRTRTIAAGEIFFAS